MTTADVVEAARLIEALTGVPPIPALRIMSTKERQAHKARLRRFLALSPELQEGALRYAENILKSYMTRQKAQSYRA